LDAKVNSGRFEGVGSYELRIKKSVVDKCGFNRVLLIWKADPKLFLEDSTWSGDLVN